MLEIGKITKNGKDELIAKSTPTRKRSKTGDTFFFFFFFTFKLKITTKRKFSIKEKIN